MNLSHVLKGFCDIHLHVAPSLIPRYCDLAEVAALADKAGYRAIVMKDHHSLSAQVAQMVKKHQFADSTLDIFGSLCMNNATGGLNPFTAEAAICWGAKIIWFPTVSSAQHIKMYGSEGKGGFPGTSVTIHENPLTLTDDSGRLKPEVVDIVKLISQSPATILATGHSSAEEINALVEKAVELGVKHIVVDHPTFNIGATLEQIKYWASLGAWIENAGTISDPKSKGFQPETSIAELIREIGVERTILSSDYGMKAYGDPIESMDQYITKLKAAGITEEELKIMCCDNTARIMYE